MNGNNLHNFAMKSLKGNFKTGLMLHEHLCTAMPMGLKASQAANIVGTRCVTMAILCLQLRKT